MLAQKGRFSAFIIRLAIIATALSVAAMIVSVALITGFKYEIREKLYNYWGHIHVKQYAPNNNSIISPDPVRRDYRLEEQIMSLPEVQTVIPFAIRPGIVNANKMMEGILLKGIDPSYDLSTLTDSRLDFSDSSYSKELILSTTTLDRLSLKEGDDMLLYFLEPGATFPRIRKVKVVGSYHTGMAEIDKSYAMCDIRLLQHINQWAADEINGYQIQLTNAAYSDSVANEIFYNIIPRDSRLTTETMQEIYPAVYDWLNLQDVNARIVLIIMAIVAIINLTVALLILIVEQARMVGLLKALGMNEKQMRKIFLYHASLIGMIGVAVGVVVGLGLCILQLETGMLKLSESTYYMQYVPIKIIWWHPVIISIATLLLCILCMWLPTLYIRRIQPAKVLQFK